MSNHRHCVFCELSTWFPRIILRRRNKEATVHKRTMHDWTLKSISVEWGSGTATFALAGPITAVTLIGHDVRSPHMPRRFAWRPSVSVNETDGPTLLDN